MKEASLRFSEGAAALHRGGALSASIGGQNCATSSVHSQSSACGRMLRFCVSIAGALSLWNAAGEY